MYKSGFSEIKLDAPCLQGLEEKGHFPINRLNAKGLRFGAMAKDPQELAQMYCYHKMTVEDSEVKKFLTKLQEINPELAEDLKSAKKPFDFLHAFYQDLKRDEESKGLANPSYTEVEMIKKFLTKEKAPLASVCDHCKAQIAKILAGIPPYLEEISETSL